MEICTYTNWIIQFDYYKSSYYALCVMHEKGGNLICYRVKTKTVPKRPEEIVVKDSNGNNMGYVVDYRCKFRIPVGCVRKLLFRCTDSYVDYINQSYGAMRPLQTLLYQYNELRFKYAHEDQSKAIRKQLNDLANEIQARNVSFLRSASERSKSGGKYSNFRKLPNKNGIARMYHGGSCSGK